MKKNKISDAMGNINEKYIEEAAAYTGSSKSTNPHKWVKLGAIAACLAVAFIGVGLWLPSLQNSNADSGSNANPPSQLTNLLNRPYKSFSTFEMAWICPWDAKTPSEKYNSMSFEGVKYGTRAQSIDESLLGDMLGSCNATGYDIYTDTIHTAIFQVYEINRISEEKLVAVDMDGEFIVFIEDAFNPPTTFGALMETYNLPETCEFSSFGTLNTNHETGFFRIANDDYIWDILSTCENAKYVEDNKWQWGERNYINFVVTSKTLGIYKHTFSVTDDGYISTNLFDYGYLYYIGKDAANQIIDYVMSNAIESPYEPYYYTIGGTITEINADYILIDDSILCVNPQDGIVFKVPADNLYIKRAIEYQGFKTGDLVQIEFTGDIDEDAGYIINGAVSMSEAMLSDGNMFVPE